MQNDSHFRISGPEVGVAEMADARERRAALQAELLRLYRVPLISFTLNIMGPVKVFPLSVRTFREGVRLIRLQLSAFRLPVLEERVTETVTGYEAFFSVDAPLRKVKEVLLRLEEHLSVGRLFDMDVIGPEGEKISRTDLGFPERTCLICGRQAFLCARSRAHTLEELLQKSCGMMQSYFRQKTAKELSSLSMQALLYEVSVTPKPGLVDRNNNGAHKDMDIFTFEASAVSLNRWFEHFALCGLRNADREEGDIFEQLRSVGIEAEDDMFRATGGVNTHKGLIFSLAVMNCALGLLEAREEVYSREKLSDLCARLSAPVRRDLTGLPSASSDAEKSDPLPQNSPVSPGSGSGKTARKLTHGEENYLKSGTLGIRGEALSGYRTVFLTALPVLDRCRRAGCSINDSGVITLLHIMAETEDSNLVSRSSAEEALAVRREIAAFLKTHDDLSPSGIRPLLSYAEALDQSFIRRNLSPGGSADLLALAFFLQLFEERLAAPGESESA